MKTLFALLLAASAAHGADFAAAFLRAGLGARGLGLGSFVAAADDASSSYWNPAGLARLRGKALETSIQSLSLGRRQGSGAVALNVRGDMGFGFAWSHAAVGGIKGRTASGQYTGLIEDRANAFIFGIGRSLGPRLAVGLAVKVLRQSIDVPSTPKATANGSGFDLGVQFRVAEHTWLGANVANLGADLAWKVRHADQRSNATENALPRILVFGASQRLVDALLLVAEFRTDGEQSIKPWSRMATQCAARHARRSAPPRCRRRWPTLGRADLAADAPRNVAVPIRLSNRSPRRWEPHDCGSDAGVLKKRWFSYSLRF